MKNKFTFDSKIKLGESLPDFTQKHVKEEPMFFRSSPEFCYNYGGELTRAFLQCLPEKWKLSMDVTIDSRVHMLMPGWWPCIPGYHHDDVARTREDGQPNYRNMPYESEHVMAMIGDCCPTEFAIGKQTFPEIKIGGIIYKEWHPLVEAMLECGKLDRVSAPVGRMIFFDWQTWHQGVKAHKRGFRWFIRATRNTGKMPTNEIRRNANVYMEAPMEGW